MVTTRNLVWGMLHVGKLHQEVELRKNIFPDSQCELVIYSRATTHIDWNTSGSSQIMLIYGVFLTNNILDTRWKLSVNPSHLHRHFDEFLSVQHTSWNCCYVRHYNIITSIAKWRRECVWTSGVKTLPVIIMQSNSVTWQVLQSTLVRTKQNLQKAM